MDIEEIIYRLEKFSDEDLDKIDNIVGNVRDKLNHIIKQRKEKKGQLDTSEISSILSNIRTRLQRMKATSFDSFVRHVDILTAKLVHAVNKLVIANEISPDEAEIYITDVEQWINSNTKDFNLELVKENFDVLLSRFIDNLNLKEDEFK